MNDIDPSKLDSLSQCFFAEVQKSFPDQELEITFTDKLEVQFKAKNPEFGNIHVWLDGDEVTVGIGDFYHTHFETYLDNTIPQDEAESSAVLESIDFINDFIIGKLILNISYRGNQAVGASVCGTENNQRLSTMGAIGGRDIFSRLFKRKKTTKRVSWNGQNDNFAKSGKEGCLAPPPHTTKHAGPHLAVPADDSTKESSSP